MMSLSLSAEQKNILNIFKIDEQYIIPEYQRPYSWNYDQCFQLYNDLMESFRSNDDYFIGNIIIAKSEKDKYELDVVDGQQRLTTFLLIIKVLSIFTDDELYKKDFESILGGMNRKTRKYEYRIKTEVFESNDAEYLNKILSYEEKDFDELINRCMKNGKLIDKECTNRFEKNIIYFYNWLKFYNNKKKSNLDDFIYFLLERVYLLPIELRGNTKEEANDKALVIFETLNNRGKNLEDADIFKAKLYKRAKNIDEEKIFIDLWISFKNSCENLKIEIDDVFRYYSHIIRGRKGITSSEINLREFFTTKDYSPFNLKKYKEIMDDLNKIIDILEFMKQETQQQSELAKWLQLIDIYSNKYPKIALIIYLFINYDDKNEKLNSSSGRRSQNEREMELNSFLESLVRYSYYHGSTSKIKFEIYSMIHKICTSQPIDNYYQETTVDDFDSLGRLKYGYALLAFYSDRKESLDKFYIDKIVNLKDKDTLAWSEEELNEFVESLGNFIILDMPKRNKPLIAKLKYYQDSKSKKLSRGVSHLLSLKYNYFEKRDQEQKEKLVKFFKGK